LAENPKFWPIVKVANSLKSFFNSFSATVGQKYGKSEYWKDLL
jgi:hypothetical protein